MARIRTIKPEFFTSADICSLPPLARLLYAALWCEADREGRFVWNPKTFKIRYLPADACDIDALCASLVESKLVVLYVADGQTYAFIPTFSLHQQINNRESDSRIPEPTEESTRQARVTDASGTRPHASVTPLVRKGRERKGSLTTCEPDWVLDDDWVREAEAKRPGVDWRAEAVRFVAHHSAKGSKFANWKSAWWTWVNSPYEKSKPLGGSGAQPDFMRGVI